MDTKKKISMATILSVSATWFGIHAGGGFASGAQTMSFLTRFGVFAFWTPILTVTLMALMYRELMILGKNHQTFDFRSLANQLYHPYDKVMAPIYEISIILANIMAISSCVAGGATVLKNYFGLPYGIGIVLIGLTMLLLSIYGAKLVASANSVFSIIIVSSVLIISIVALTNGNANLSSYVSTPEASSTPLSYVILKSISYAGFQAYAFAGLLGVSEFLKTERSINTSIGIGWLINVVMLWLTSLVMLAYMPASGQATLPLYYVCETTGQKFVMLAYVIALFAAYISTGVGVNFGMVKRYSKIVLAKKPEANEAVTNFIIGAVFIAVTVFAATFGLTKIINYGFGYMGYVGMVLVFLPTITIGHIKNKRFAKEHPNFDEENLNRE